MLCAFPQWGWEHSRTRFKLHCCIDYYLLFEMWQKAVVLLYDRLEAHLYLHMCPMWLQCFPDHLQKWFGRSDNNQSCPVMWLSAIQLQSDHRKRGP